MQSHLALQTFESRELSGEPTLVAFLHGDLDEPPPTDQYEAARRAADRHHGRRRRGDPPPGLRRWAGGYLFRRSRTRHRRQLHRVRGGCRGRDPGRASRPAPGPAGSAGGALRGRRCRRTRRLAPPRRRRPDGRAVGSLRRPGLAGAHEGAARRKPLDRTGGEPLADRAGRRRRPARLGPASSSVPRTRSLRPG